MALPLRCVWEFWQNRAASDRCTSLDGVDPDGGVVHTDLTSIICFWSVSVRLGCSVAERHYGRWANSCALRAFLAVLASGLSGTAASTATCFDRWENCRHSHDFCSLPLTRAWWAWKTPPKWSLLGAGFSPARLPWWTGTKSAYGCRIIPGSRFPSANCSGSCWPWSRRNLTQTVLPLPIISGGVENCGRIIGSEGGMEAFEE